jgi:hypothetical protein
LHRFLHLNHLWQRIKEQLRLSLAEEQRAASTFTRNFLTVICFNAVQIPLKRFSGLLAIYNVFCFGWSDAVMSVRNLPEDNLRLLKTQ